MLSRTMLTASQTPFIAQKRNFMSLVEVGFYCVAPLAVSSASVIMQIEIEDHQKLRARVDAAKKGSNNDKAGAIEMAVMSRTFGRRRAVTDVLASVDDADRFDLSCGKSTTIRNALSSSCFSGDQTLAAAILSKGVNPCSCITFAVIKNTKIQQCRQR